MLTDMEGKNLRGYFRLILHALGAEMTTSPSYSAAMKAIFSSYAFCHSDLNPISLHSFHETQNKSRQSCNVVQPNKCLIIFQVIALSLLPDSPESSINVFIC